MTWAEATYKIIVEGGGGLITAIILLAMFTSFFDNLFGPEEVEVFPESAKSDLTEIAVEMRAASLDRFSATQLIDWSKRINKVVEEDE